MVFTYISLFVGIAIGIAFFGTYFYANRLELRAYEAADRQDQFIILEANPNESGFWIDLLVFVGIALGAYFVNTFSLSSFDPIMIIGVILVGVSSDIRDRFSDEHQQIKEAEKAVPASYKDVQRKAELLRNLAGVIWFAYLVFVF